MNVAILDQSNFSIPYVSALAGGLIEAGCGVTIYCRPPRQAESLNFPSNMAVKPKFARITTRPIFDSLPNIVRGGIKGVEYFADLLRFEITELRKFDVVHIQWSILPFVERIFFSRWQRRVRLIMTVHDTVPFLGTPTSKLQLLGWLPLIKSIQSLVVHTEQGRMALIDQGIRNLNISVIPHGILSRGDQRKKKVQERDPNSNTLSALLFGHIKRYKGVFELIKAIGLARKRLGTSLKLTIAGKLYVDQSSIRALISNCHVDDTISVRAGFMPDDTLDTLLHNADIILFPYSMVDASGALLKALPYGKAIIATRVGLFKEILTNDKDCILIENNDPQVLSRHESPVLPVTEGVRKTYGMCRTGKYVV